MQERERVISMKKMEHLFLGTLLVVLFAMAGCDQGLGVNKQSLRREV
jgi:hypothetical protein